MISWLKSFFERESTDNDRRGRVGEDAAAEFFQKRLNCKIVTRNWVHKKDEIDLICRDRDVLVFVEIKARAENALVPGYFAVNERKKKALRRAIHAYLQQLSNKPRTFRFDVAEVILSPRLPPQVLHFENVQLFPKGYHALRN